MSSVIISRPPRQPGPALPSGQLDLQEPPGLPETVPADLSSAMMYLPMGLGSGATVLMFANPSSGPMAYLASGMMGMSTLGMVFGQMGRSAGERRRRLKGERRDYLRYLAQTRKQVRAALDQQRLAVRWDHPEPGVLWSVATGPRLWERRPGHEDFAEVRVGTGRHRSTLRLVPPSTKPVEDLEPLCASALRRFIHAYSTVSGVPTSLHLRGFAKVAITGDPDRRRSLARSVLTQLATFHAPEELRIAVLAGTGEIDQWDWVKWLPHALHPTETDAAGPVRLFAHDHDGLMRTLGTTFTERRPFEAGTVPTTTEPYLVVLTDGAALDSGSSLAGLGWRNAVVLDLSDDATDHLLRIALTDDRMTLTDDSGELAQGSPDALSLPEAEALARLLTPLRTGGAVDAAEPLEVDFDLTRLLGIQDAHNFDVQALWQSRSRWAQLRVPVGLGADGAVVELDIKESAQGGMGPHGVVIGATGSGKSELLRTLVIALAATHAPQSLNFVLVDFKGGATFLGLDDLPHTSAVITNLAEELSMVDRMQDSLHGELIRRQELLRQNGYSSRLEYENARGQNGALDPLPTLFIVCDEFSELLASKPEFMDLFVMIGRLGRSLGVHLLLASQRLDEGRIHALESHLSYRIALRTFSSMESRSVIGVADAYELPSSPGNGYLKIDTTNLVRFKASYVSGPYHQVATASTAPLPGRDVLAYGLHRSAAGPPSVEVPSPVIVPADDISGERATTSLLSVLVGRLAGEGSPARQVWLPPLADSPSIDQLLPSVVPDATRGLTARDWAGCGQLRVPVGVVDRPFEQVRELLLADLSAAAGHVGIVGAPQSGKSTLVRTLLAGLALTHTPREVQFYCLDFGGGTLSALAGLPHVGSVASRLDRDRVRRTIAELHALMERREREFAELGIESMTAYRRLRGAGGGDRRYGDVFLVVDGWFTLRQDYEDLESRISELATRGLSYGVHLVVTASRWSEIRPWLRDLLGTRFELRLGDPLESEIGSRLAAGVPALPGRGLTPAALHFLAALPRLDGSSDTGDISSATKALVEEVAEFWPGEPAPEVRLLPARLPVAALPAAEGDLRVALGWDEQRLEPVWHDFGQIPHLMVFGDSETGKTNLLELVAHNVISRYHPDQARIMLGDFRRDLTSAVPEEYRSGFAVTTESLTALARSAHASLHGRLPGPDISPDRLRLRDWWSGPELYVLVDDYELVGGTGGPLEHLVPLLAQGADIGLHVVVARSTSGAMRAMMDPVLRRLWELGTPGLVLSYPKEEGKFLGEATPRLLPPGRAQLVTRRGVQLVQTGLAARQAKEDK